MRFCEAFTRHPGIRHCQLLDRKQRFAGVAIEHEYVTRLRHLGDGGPTAKGPRGLAVVGSKAFVGAYFTDNLSVVDLEPKPANAEPTDLVSTTALGPSPALSVSVFGQSAGSKCWFAGSTSPAI